MRPTPLAIVVTVLFNEAAAHVFVKRATASPVLSHNFPDPCLAKSNRTWYAFSTSSSSINVPMASSTDFMAWTSLPQDALPSLPGWVNVARPGIWAPDVTRRDDGTWLLYFSARTAAMPERHCIGAATSKQVTGPYTALEQPVVCPLERGGAIDAAGFRDWAWTGKGKSREKKKGRRYLLYKVDGGTLGHGGVCGNDVPPLVPAPIVLQEVKEDGVTLVGSRQTLLDHSEGDQGVVEAPSLVKTRKGSYVLFFSSGCFVTSRYQVNHATAASINGPYARQKPLVQTGDFGLYAPGGADVFHDGRHMVFHANNRSADGGPRLLHTVLLHFTL